MSRHLHPVVEFSSFRAKAARLLSVEERTELIDFVATDPRIGKEYDGTGGVRQLRWPIPEHGKKEKAELGYFFGDGSTPVLLVTLCKPGEKGLLAKVIRGLAAGA